MIKIGPLVATDYGQACALLGLQEERVLDVQSLTESGLVLRSLAFWQHWVPCRFHVTPSIYVAREEHMVLGFVSLHPVGKSKACWRIDNLVVHPEHRGRGIAQELLRYIFAQFGSQGVSHFIAEIGPHNDAALSLFAACGFCRSAKVSYFRLNPSTQTEIDDLTDEHLLSQESASSSEFHIAIPGQRQALYQLFQDSLPPDLRQVLNLSPEDFRVRDLLAFTSVEKSKNRLMRRRIWYWFSQDQERRTMTGAVRITAQLQLGYRLDLAVHPGWRHLSSALLNQAINSLLTNVPRQPIWVRLYDFQTEAEQTLVQRGFERMGDFFLLSREHWQRAKYPKKRRVDRLKPIANPAISFPLATERGIISKPQT